MMGSFVPVILVGAGLGPGGVGWLVTLSESAGVAALLALRRVHRRRVRPIVWTAGVTISVALAALALAPPIAAVYGALMVVGGAASGTATTLAPAMASLAAGPEEQGDAMALTGTFRAAALFGGPAAVGALLSVVALTPALLAIAAVAVIPGLTVAGPTSSAPRDGGSTVPVSTDRPTHP